MLKLSIARAHSTCLTALALACVTASTVAESAQATRDGPGSNLGIDWVSIPPGTFQMGCAPPDARCRPNEQPRHEVAITHGFALMATEVTVSQFRQYGAATRGRLPRQPHWNHDDHPVVNVTWQDIREFCAWVGGRLPTEAEWEYAARGGTTTTYPWGEDFTDDQTNGLGQAGTDRWNETAPVGSFPPNAYGLFDMIGNVWEWVGDWYWARMYENSPVLNPTGSPEGTERVLRGGSWDNATTSLRASFRIKLPPNGRYNLYVGGRCARDAIS